METYKTKLQERVCSIYQPAILKVNELVTRQALIAREWIVDFPVIERRKNRHRKDTDLTTEQKENLTKVHGISVFTIKDSKTGKNRPMQERDVLAVLRKRYKKYTFDTKISNSLN
jgi:hypothetical protein